MQKEITFVLDRLFAQSPLSATLEVTVNGFRKKMNLNKKTLLRWSAITLISACSLLAHLWLDFLYYMTKKDLQEQFRGESMPSQSCVEAMGILAKQHDYGMDVGFYGFFIGMPLILLIFKIVR